jgi:hypothetical protein
MIAKGVASTLYQTPNELSRCWNVIISFMIKPERLSGNELPMGLRVEPVGLVVVHHQDDRLLGRKSSTLATSPSYVDQLSACQLQIEMNYRFKTLKFKNLYRIKLTLVLRWIVDVVVLASVKVTVVVLWAPASRRTIIEDITRTTQ